MHACNFQSVLASTWTESQGLGQATAAQRVLDILRLPQRQHITVKSALSNSSDEAFFLWAECPRSVLPSGARPVSTPQFKEENMHSNPVWCQTTADWPTQTHHRQAGGERQAPAQAKPGAQLQALGAAVPPAQKNLTKSFNMDIHMRLQALRRQNRY